MLFCRKIKSHVLFNTSSMISVAKRSGNRRKLSQIKITDTDAEVTRVESAVSTINTFSTSGPRVQSKDRGKLGTPVLMSGPVKLEHSIVVKSLVECIGSRLSQEVGTILKLTQPS